MKVVSFFSRFAIVCNIAFLVFIIMGRMEARTPVTQPTNTVMAVSYVKDIIITLGVGAIIINLALCIVYAILVARHKQALIPRNLALINCSFFIVQLIYFFFR